MIKYKVFLHCLEYWLNWQTELFSTMDEIDKKILMLLQQNSKQNTKEIADKIGLTVSPTFERIKKLEQQQYIKNYVAILNGDKIEKTLLVYCQISAFPEVMACLHVSGNYDFLLKISVKDMTGYQQLVVDKLSIIKGISNVQSSFVMESIKDETGYIL